jgi:urease accessory protein
LLAASPALAHHGMDEALPATWAQGLISGVAHPVIGLDHLAFLVAAGLIASRLPTARLILPLAFVGAGFVGSMLHLASIDLFAVEMLVALSSVIGAVLLWRAPSGALPTAAFFALAGLFHGHAFAEAIIGAEATPLVAYLAGLAVTQYGLVCAIALGAGLLAIRDPSGHRLALRAGAGVTAAVGLVFLVA